MIREQDLLRALDLFDRGHSILESADSIGLAASEFEYVLRNRHARITEAVQRPLAGMPVSGWEKRRKPATLPVFSPCASCGQEYIARRIKKDLVA